MPALCGRRTAGKSCNIAERDPRGKLFHRLRIHRKPGGYIRPDQQPAVLHDRETVLRAVRADAEQRNSVFPDRDEIRDVFIFVEDGSKYDAVLRYGSIFRRAVDLQRIFVADIPDAAIGCLLYTSPSPRD